MGDSVTDPFWQFLAIYWPILHPFCDLTILVGMFLIFEKAEEVEVAI